MCIDILSYMFHTCLLCCSHVHRFGEILIEQCSPQSVSVVNNIDGLTDTPQLNLQLHAAWKIRYGRQNQCSPSKTNANQCITNENIAMPYVRRKDNLPLRA